MSPPSARRRRIPWRLRRAVARVHRAAAWIGAGCALVWFVSGMVMLFVTYPDVDEGERLAWRPPLAALPERPPEVGASSRLRYRVLGDRTVVDVSGPAGSRTVELDGRPLAPLAADGVAALVPPSVGAGLRLDTVLARPDQFTLFPSHRAQLPLARLENRDGVIVHVALATGEIVQRTTRRERVLAWLGPIPHWLYPAALVEHRAVWRQLVLWLAGIGMVSTASGLALGLWSLRRRRSPFTRRWLRAHHHLGLVFGFVTFTWCFSGALSLGPFRWSPGSAPAAPELTALGGTFDPASPAIAVGPAAALATCAPLIVRELELRAVLGRPSWICRASRTDSLIVDAATGATRTRVTGAEVVARLQAAGVTLGAPPAAIGADAYVYPSRHGRTAEPLIRVVLADGSATRIYVGAADGRPVARYGPRARAERWLYHGLHSFDVPGLRERPWLRLPLIVGLLLGGLALALTSLVGLCARLARCTGWRSLSSRRSGGRRA